MAKGTRTAAEFGHPAVAAQAKQPLRDAAVVNTTRWALYARLQQTTGLPVEVGTGGRAQKKPTPTRVAQAPLPQPGPPWGPPPPPPPARRGPPPPPPPACPP